MRQLFFPRWVPALLVPAGFASLEADSRPRWFLVEPPGLSAAWKPLAEHRQQSGHVVVSIPLDENQSWEQVRDKLQAAGAGTVAGDCVVLAGDAASPDASCRVPIGHGSQVRMTGRLTDAAFIKSLEESGREVHLGRLPARNPAEASVMVKKILDFETSNPPGLWRRRVGLIVGNPSATNQTNSFVDAFVSSIADQQLTKVHPAWTFRGLAHLDGHPFQIPGPALRDETLATLGDSYLFCAYLGHSNARSLASKGRHFFSENDWALIPAEGTHGVLFSTGCNALDCSSEKSTAYGFAAVRSAGGPAAYIGATLESCAAMGFLALGGITEMLSQPDPPNRLGEFWSLVRKGLASGFIDPGQFAMMDQFDGTKGRVPLEKQRLEHLEMWQLLGDPAMRFPRLDHTISLTCAGDIEETGPLWIEGTLPEKLSSSPVNVTLERPLTVPPALAHVPPGPASERDRALLDNLRRANDFILARATGTADHGRFRVALDRPALSLPDPCVIRAVAVQGESGAQGTLLKRRKPSS